MKKTLYKTDLKGKVREWTIEVEGNKYRTISGLIDGEKVVSDWSYAQGKNVGKANGTTDEEQALKIAESYIRIRKEQGHQETIEEAGKGKDWYQCMLAAKWEAVKDKVVVDEEHPIYVQPKLDGARNIDYIERMQTRTGKTWVASPHIQEKLQTVFAKYPDIMFDGELYNHDLNEDFNKIISLIKKSKPTAADLAESAELVQYWIYDLPSCPGVFSERYEMLKSIFEEFNLDNSFVLVPTFKVTDKNDVQKYLEKFVSEGYEGAIVRIDAEYESRRSKNLLKVKQFQDEEYIIIDIEEGRGNLANKAGRIIVDVDGVRVSAGLKFSHDEAAEIWNNRAYYIGKKATIKYFNKTEDGSLRFPKCIQIDRESYE